MKKTTVVNDFKKFTDKGNVLDLAVAVVVGAAFNKIVSSLANNIISPLAGIWFGGINLSEYKWTYHAGLEDAVEVSWGVFVQAILEFTVTALFVFLVLRILKRIKKHWIKLEEKAKKEIQEAIKKEKSERAREKAALKENNSDTDKGKSNSPETATPAVPATPEVPKEPTTNELLIEIRDLLKSKP